MSNQVFYKYRSLANWKFVLDAIANSRLYAATFDTLNDRRKPDAGAAASAAWKARCRPSYSCAAICVCRQCQNT